MSRTWRWRLRNERYAQRRDPAPLRSEWPRGPWDDESDLYLFSEAGYQCKVLRHPSYGSLCGYVRLPRRHPWLRLDYDDIPVYVHGGLTYKRQRTVGFDCAHARDFMPGMYALLQAHGALLRDPREGHPLVRAEYRSAEYVIEQTRYLAIQAFLAERGYPALQHGDEA